MRIHTLSNNNNSSFEAPNTVQASDLVRLIDMGGGLMSNLMRHEVHRHLWQAPPLRRRAWIRYASNLLL
jgi:hypothetical protein